MIKKQWQKNVEKAKNNIKNLEKFLELTIQKNSITQMKLAKIKTKLAN